MSSSGPDSVNAGAHTCGAAPCSPGPGLVSALRTAGASGRPAGISRVPAGAEPWLAAAHRPVSPVLSEDEDGPRSRCLTTPGSVARRGPQTSPTTPVSG